ncbi:glycosyltransferase family 4 protein [Porifericola rhodea]|uniref:glycosyltransferase family 4 protein n=1 Tax=Porifericola rhodea TaxID=930972 RepID=UPI002664F963|nr:glycosyltransferase family 4 protein [Porifericola rhodea]WKN32528.1 glycosyltransferase family 4 protein [Porifericola rhodea]
MKKNLKVLIISTRDKVGGAAKAAYRLHQSFLSSGIDSYMLVLSKTTTEDRILGPEGIKDTILSKVTPSLNSLYLNYISRKKSRRVFSTTYSLYSISQKIKKIDPDIVNFHWVGDGFFSMNQLKNINYPIFWTLHDMWPFTGGCHYAMECENYQSKCGKCPALSSNKAHDLSSTLFEHKQNSYGKCNITVVALSNWLAECARKSALFNKNDIVVLPNPINTHIYKPLDKTSARKLLNLPVEGRLVLFGAMNQSSPIKGFNKLVEAVGALPKGKLELVILGASQPQEIFEAKHKVHYLGRLVDDISLVAAYSAADVVVVPSIYENLSNVIMESLACGTPVAAFDIGGNSDLITHEENGYLAKPYDTKDLAQGINWIIEKDERRLSLQTNSRNSVLKKYNSKFVAEAYISLFQKKLDLSTLTRFTENETY